MMSVLLIAVIFVLAFVVTVQFGWPVTYVTVFLPTLILLNQLPEIPIPHLPISVQNGPLYAILLGMPFRGEKFRLKLCSIDIVFILLLISATITAWKTEYFETGVNTFRTDLLTLTLPYFLARVVFADLEMRRLALTVLISVMALVAFCALIEVRMVPYFYQHILQSLELGNKLNGFSYSRYGFFRVSGPVEHPIYFGNMCLGIMGMIAVLVKSTGASLRNGWVATALFACFGCIVVSISFTPYMGCIAGTLALITMIAVPFTRKLIFPGTLLLAVALFSYTYHEAHTPLGDKPEGELPGSIYTRHMIIIESWKKAEAAGPFGLGIRPIFADDEDFDLKSIDNSYMQFSVTHGYIYTSLWSSIGLLFAWRVGSAFRKIRHPSQVFPLAAATATILGLMVSMYTVWAGALYTVIWVILLGLGNTLIDQVLAAAKQPRTAVVPNGPPAYSPPRAGGPAVAY